MIINLLISKPTGMTLLDKSSKPFVDLFKHSLIKSYKIIVIYFIYILIKNTIK